MWVFSQRTCSNGQTHPELRPQPEEGSVGLLNDTLHVSGCAKVREIVKQAHTFTCACAHPCVCVLGQKQETFSPFNSHPWKDLSEQHRVGQVWTQHRPGWTQTTQTLTGTLSWWICAIKRLWTWQEKHKRGRIVFRCCTFLCTCLLLSKNSSCIDRLSFPVCIRGYGRMTVQATIERWILDTI